MWGNTGGQHWTTLREINTGKRRETERERGEEKRGIWLALFRSNLQICDKLLTPIFSLILYTYSNITAARDAFRGDTDTQTSTPLHTHMHAQHTLECNDD